MDIIQMSHFLGWCLLINCGILFVSTIVLVLGGSWASGMHAKMFQLDETRIRQNYFGYLANFKIAVIVFNLVPWIATKLM